MRHEERRTRISFEIRFIAIRQTNDFLFFTRHNLKTESSPSWHFFTYNRCLLMRQQHARFNMVQHPLSHYSQSNSTADKGRYGWYNGNALSLLFGRCSVRISTRTPVNQTEIFAFPSPQVPRLCHARFLPNSNSPFINHPHI
jgi:hypothetical protein